MASNTLAELEEKVETLERDYFRIQQEKTQIQAQTSSAFPKHGAGAGQGAGEDARMLKDITK